MPSILRHGGCPGGDIELAGLVREATIIAPRRFECIVHRHPGCNFKDGEAKPDLSDYGPETYDHVLHVFETHLKRNRTIVDQSDMLLGFPEQMEHQDFIMVLTWLQ